MMNAELQCCQLFEELFGQSRRKIRPLRKIRSPSSFKFLKEFGLKKHYFRLRGKETFLDFPRIRKNMRRETIFLKFGLFRPFLFKISLNSAADLSGRFIFYSAFFDFCGRTIGQLATLLNLPGSLEGEAGIAGNVLVAKGEHREATVGAGLPAVCLHFA